MSETANQRLLGQPRTQIHLAHSVFVKVFLKMPILKVFIQKMPISHSFWKSHLAMLRRHPSRPRPTGMEELVLPLTRHGLPNLPQPLPLPSTLRLSGFTRVSPAGPYRHLCLFLRTWLCPEEIRGGLHIQSLGTRQRTLDLPQILEQLNRA